ncbi:MAG: DUF1080 domain-containing protein [bacterium]
MSRTIGFIIAMYTVFQHSKARLFLFITILLVVFIALFIATCVTFPTRNTSFENGLRSFADARNPGSEFSLFNGEDLSGWSVHGVGKWTISDGVLTVRRGLGYLATRCDQFDDFILTLEIRVSEEGNSGVFFRSRRPGFGTRPWPIGYETQVDNHDPKNPTGSLYDRVTASPLPAKDEEWFKMEVSAVGASLSVKVNGETVAQATDTTYVRGIIALQAHDLFSRVDFKNIRIRIPER